MLLLPRIALRQKPNSYLGGELYIEGKRGEVGVGGMVICERSVPKSEH